MRDQASPSVRPRWLLAPYRVAIREAWRPFTEECRLRAGRGCFTAVKLAERNPPGERQISIPLVLTELRTLASSLRCLGTDGSQTHRWREMDSNFWYRTKAVNFGSVPGIAGVSARSPQKPHFLGNNAPWRPINPKAPCAAQRRRGRMALGVRARYRTGEKDAGISSLFSCRIGRTPACGGQAPPGRRDSSRTRARSLRSL